MVPEGALHAKQGRTAMMLSAIPHLEPQVRIRDDDVGAGK